MRSSSDYGDGNYSVFHRQVAIHGRAEVTELHMGVEFYHSNNLYTIKMKLLK